MQPYIIALDAMGGDYAPQEIIRGAILSLQAFPDISIILVGQIQIIQSLLRGYSYPSERLMIREAPEVVYMDESPLIAVRQKKDASISVALGLVKNNQAHAIITAGNSGAAIVSATVNLKMLPGIERPAMAVLFPGLERETILLDVGANIQCKPIHYQQYALLGACYASYLLQRPNPRVGLINIGEESTKGSPLIKDTYQKLKSLPIDFVGNIEGWDLVRSKVDVAICDGFVGNIILKLSEGLGELFLQAMEEHAVEPSQLGLKFDYAEYGGSVVLGVNGVVIITHGRAQAKAIANAVAVARRNIENKMLEKTQIFFEQLNNLKRENFNHD